MNYVHISLCNTCIGTIIEGPSSVTYLPGVTPLPIELICNVTGMAKWVVNGTSYVLSQLTNGALPGHNRTGTNILVASPVNNTMYICASLSNFGDVYSVPAYIIVPGEYNKCHICMIVAVNHNTGKSALLSLLDI